MLKILTTAIVFFLTVQSAVAQRSLPLIKATSKSIDIRDKGIRRKNAWTITPDLKPDVYTTSAKNEKLLFTRIWILLLLPLNPMVFTTLLSY